MKMTLNELKKQLAEAVEDLNAGASYDEINKELDDASLEEFCQQLDFLVKSDDEKAKALFNTFKKGWKNEYKNIRVKLVNVGIRDLQPTQNVIYAQKSLVPILNGTWRINNYECAVDAMLGAKAPLVVMGDPLVVCNVGGTNYLIDGHHRWSKVYAFNPNCYMRAYTIEGAFNDEEEVLKFAQGTLTLLRNKSPINPQTNKDTNLYDITPAELKGIVYKNTTSDVLDHIRGAMMTKGVVKDMNTLFVYLWSNVNTMRQYAPGGDHDRDVMPQFPDGDTNPKNALDAISENSKVTLTIGQIRRLIKEARLNWKGPKVVKRKWDGYTGEVTFRLGKIADEEYYHNTARRCPVDITIATDMGHFSATAMIGNANDTGFNHAGQIIDLIADHNGYIYKQLPDLSKAMVDKIAGWWEQYHLKGLDKIPEEDLEAISQVIEYAKDYEV